MIKSCSGHLKTCKSIENRKSKIFANPILSSYVLEESKKKRNSIFMQYLLILSCFLAIQPKLRKENLLDTRGSDERDVISKINRKIVSCALNKITLNALNAHMIFCRCRINENSRKKKSDKRNL